MKERDQQDASEAEAGDAIEVVLCHDLPELLAPRKVTHVFAVPGKHHIIDEVNPLTGRSMVDGHTLAEVQARNPGAVLIARADWKRERAAEQDTPVEWTEVDEERYDEMLNVLPPVNLTHDGFQVGEPQDHHVVSGQPRFDSYRLVGGKHYVGSRPMTSAEFRARKSQPTK